MCVCVQHLRGNIYTPCVLQFTGLILSSLEAIDKDHLDFIPDMKGVVNFQKRRQYAKVVQQVQKYQNTPYSLHPIEVSTWVYDCCMHQFCPIPRLCRRREKLSSSCVAWECGLRMWLISMTWFTIVRYGLGYFSGLVLIPNQPIFH